MYHSIPKQNRKANGGIYFSSALTSFLTGITEPLEYMFLFVAPWLYVVHAFLDGVSFYVADLLSIRIGNTFSGGLIDFLLFGPLQGNAKTNWIWVIPVGILWALIYYFVFRFLITKFKVMVPGMDESETDANMPVAPSGKASTLNDEAQIIIQALGNQANIESVTACATRLRVSVKDGSIVDKNTIKNLGATAVFEVQGGIQAVFGGKADFSPQKTNKFWGPEDYFGNEFPVNNFKVLGSTGAFSFGDGPCTVFLFFCISRTAERSRICRLIDYRKPQNTRQIALLSGIRLGWRCELPRNHTSVWYSIVTASLMPDQIVINLQIQKKH